MTPELAAIGRSFVAELGWAWKPGMAVVVNGVPGRLYAGNPGTVCWQAEHGRAGWISDIVSTAAAAHLDAFPDLSDDGTWGVVLNMVRAMHNEPRLTTRWVHWKAGHKDWWEIGFSYYGPSK